MAELKMQRRMMIGLALLLSMFLASIVRIGLIDRENYAETAEQQNSVTLSLSPLRGNLFDCNGKKLTGNNYETKTVFAPTPQAIRYAQSVLTGEEADRALSLFKSGKPYVSQQSFVGECDGVYTVQIPCYENGKSQAQHLCGYTDRDLNGISGLQKAYDDQLKSDQSVRIRFAGSGSGRALAGIRAVVEEGEDVTESGIVTTLDSSVQSIVESVGTQIEQGAIVVSRVKNGELAACASFPGFDPEKAGEYLERSDSPFLNRALCSYNVGSAFKLCVAAAALNHNQGDFVNICSGKVSLDGHDFYCHKRSGHGQLDLAGAIRNSCNTYFYQFSQIVGARSIYETATGVGFGYERTVCPGLKTSGESLPTLASLEENPKALANLAIGQGTLLASPVTLSKLYEAIANQGVYYPTRVVCGAMKRGSLQPDEENPTPTRLMSQETAEQLRKMLIGVVEEGTGRAARPQTVTAGGKTATAQTGRREENGKEIEHSWFCGFFPAENPEYVITVFEEGFRASQSASAVFAQLADGIYRVTRDQKE